MNEIPIQNIYYLLCYAWDKLEERDVVNVGKMESPEILDLFSRVLISGVTHLIKKGVDRNYVMHSEDIRGVKGKVNFSETLKRNLLNRCYVNCDFDDFSYNILHNQILKTTLGKLVKIKKINSEYRKELAGLYNYFHYIDELSLSHRHFGMVRLHRNNYFYDFLLKICSLIYENWFVDENERDSKFRDFIRDPRQMNMLFEKFVRNFYHKEQNEYKVGREIIRWDAKSIDEESEKHLPAMETDINLESKERKIIIDTKYYSKTLQEREGKSTVHSSNLYQLFAYLKNAEVYNQRNKKNEGILLYPTVTDEVDYNYVVSGHKVRIKTINLNQDWKNIHNSLLEIINV